MRHPLKQVAAISSLFALVVVASSFFYTSGPFRGNIVDPYLEGYPSFEDDYMDDYDYMYDEGSDSTIGNQCNNGIDEDMDGITDDEDCDTVYNDSSGDDPCNNGIDEDMDGIIDDEDCDTVYNDSSGDDPCNNGIDEDMDGIIDDDDCDTVYNDGSDGPEDVEEDYIDSFGN